MDKINELANKPIGRLLAQYSMPATLSLLVSALYQMTDRIFIGHIPNIGLLGLTAVGLTAPITTIITALSALLAFGAGSTISILLGEEKKEQAEMTAGNSMIYALIMSLFVTVFYFIFKQHIFVLLKITGQASLYAANYLDIIILGTVVNVFSFIFPILIRSDGNPNFSMAVTLTGCILNIILGAIFIMVLNMGIQGASIATVISQLTSTIMGLLYFFKGKSSLKISGKSFRLSFTLLKSMVKIGTVPCTNQLSVSVAQVVGNYSLMLYGGELYVGAMTAIRSVFQLFMMGVYGMGQGFQPIVGYNYAKKNYQRTFQTLKLAMIWDVGILTIGFMLIQLFPAFWISLFIQDSILLDLAREGLQKFMILLPLAVFVAVGTGFMMVTGKAKSAIMISISYQIIISAAVIYLLPLVIGTDGLWYSQPISDVLGGILTVFLFIRGYGSLITKTRGLKKR